MTHEVVLTVFVIVTALAVVMQAAILFGMYRSLQVMHSKISGIESGMKDHVNPVLDSLHAIINTSREPLNAILANMTEVTGLLRQRAASADAVAAEAIERARVEIIRVDELLAGILGRMERVADAAERGVLAPLREVSALIAGVRRGVGFFFARQRKAGQQAAPQHEELFI